MSHQKVLTAQKAVSWSESKDHSQMVEGDDSTPLLHSDETPPGVLCPILEFSNTRKNWPVGAGPEEGPNNDQRDGTPLL